MDLYVMVWRIYVCSFFGVHETSISYCGLFTSADESCSLFWHVYSLRTMIGLHTAYISGRSFVYIKGALAPQLVAPQAVLKAHSVDYQYTELITDYSSCDCLQ